jgi:hypothetical protein
MLEDSDRFAFIPRRIHAFATSGNAYDACQTDRAIESGHTLIILSEGVVALAGTWPIAVTAAGGVLHSVVGKSGDTLESLAAAFDLMEEDIVTAVNFARAFGFVLDPVFSQICP